MSSLLVRYQAGIAPLSLKKLLGFSVPFLFLLFFILVFGYVYMHGYSVNEVVSKIGNRAFGLQGHVWYGVDNLAQQGAQLATFSDLFRVHTEDEPAGLIMLMWLISLSDLVANLRELNIRFTMGAPAIAVATVGYFGALFYQVFAAFISALSVSYLYNSLVSLRFYRVLVALLIFKILLGFILMGDPYVLFKPVLIALVLFSLFDKVLVSICRKY